jgi:hypothetical protein
MKNQYQDQINLAWFKAEKFEILNIAHPHQHKKTYRDWKYQSVDKQLPGEEFFQNALLK